MNHTIRIVCPRCGREDLRKNGHSPNGTQRFVCVGCKKYFQVGFRYNARMQGIKEKIADMSVNWKTR